jgi:hypothetical protein
MVNRSARLELGLAATYRRRLKCDDASSNRHHTSALCLSMIFSENRHPLFEIML